MSAKAALDPSELERRRGAWDALSFLFLDTEVRDWLPGAAVTLVELGYTCEDIEGIFLDEVTPVLHLNLKQVAGLWSGFDLDWLAGEIQKRKPPPVPRRFGRFRRMVSRMRAWPATTDFDVLLVLVEAARARPVEKRSLHARVLSTLVHAYFEDARAPLLDHHVRLLSESGFTDAELLELVAEVRRLFGPLRLRTQDPKEPVGLQQIDALLTSVSRAR